MPLQPTPAFIHTGTWDSQTRADPAMNWMETYTKTVIDGRAWETHVPFTDWFTDDFTLHKADGTIIHGGHETWTQGLPSIYGPFKSHVHEPNFLVWWETGDGWEMIGQADVSVELGIEGGAEEKETKDAGGKGWDCVTPGAFHFVYVRDEKAAHGGILLKSTRIFADSGPALLKMLKVGLVKPQDHGL